MVSSGWSLSLEIVSQTMFFCLLNMCIGLFSVPRLMCAEMIHECLVGYTTRIGWNSTDSIFSPCAKMCRRRNLKQKSNCECCASLFTVFLMHSLLMKCLLWCIRGKVWQVVWMVDELAGSPKFWVHIS